MNNLQKFIEIQWFEGVEGWRLKVGISRTTIWCQDGSYPSVGVSWLPHSLHLDQILQEWNNMRLREIKHCRLATSSSLKQWGMWFACGYFGTGEVRTCLFFFVRPFCACMHSSALWSLVPLAAIFFFIAGMSNLNQDCALALVNIPLENWLKSRAWRFDCCLIVPVGALYGIRTALRPWWVFSSWCSPTRPQVG